MVADGAKYGQHSLFLPTAKQFLTEYIFSVLSITEHKYSFSLFDIFNYNRLSLFWNQREGGRSELNNALSSDIQNDINIVASFFHDCLYCKNVELNTFLYFSVPWLSKMEPFRTMDDQANATALCIASS